METSKRLEIACTTCSRAKVKCDRQVPCGRCTGKGIECQSKPRARRTSRASAGPTQPNPEASNTKKPRRASKDVKADTRNDRKSSANAEPSIAAFGNHHATRTSLDSFTAPKLSKDNSFTSLNSLSPVRGDMEHSWNDMLESVNYLEGTDPFKTSDIQNIFSQPDLDPRTSMDSMISAGLISPLSAVAAAVPYSSTTQPLTHQQPNLMLLDNTFAVDNSTMDRALQDMNLDMDWAQMPVSGFDKSYNDASNQIRNQQDFNLSTYNSTPSTSSSRQSIDNKSPGSDAGLSDQPRGKLIAMTQKFINNALTNSKSARAETQFPTGVASNRFGGASDSAHGDRRHRTPLADSGEQTRTLPKEMVEQLLEILQPGQKIAV